MYDVDLLTCQVVLVQIALQMFLEINCPGKKNIVFKVHMDLEIHFKFFYCRIRNLISIKVLLWLTHHTCIQQPECLNLVIVIAVHRRQRFLDRSKNL